MKDKIETDKIWIDVETLAILKNITKRAVRLSLNKNKYEYIIENVKGGKTYKIKLSSIEENYQKKYIQEMYIKDNYINSELIELNNFKWILAREGEKALKDKVSPFIVRNASLLKAGQVLVADGHTLNFQVINPFTGKPCRATLLGFLDWKSGGLVGYDIMLEECTQNIASALRNAILNMNHIPEFVYQDNGRAFKSKFFNGDKKFEELEDYKHKVKKQARLRKKTIKAVKEHCNISDIDFITKQLENYPNQTANNTSSESKFLAKVRSNNNARPIFKTSFERYEWHIKNGCIDINDKIWLANYIKSNEFKSIYK